MKYRVTVRRTKTCNVMVEVEAGSMREAGHAAHRSIEDFVTASMWTDHSTRDDIIAVAALGECSECNGRRWFRGMEGEDVPCSRCNS